MTPEPAAIPTMAMIGQQRAWTLDNGYWMFCKCFLGNILQVFVWGQNTWPFICFPPHLKFLSMLLAWLSDQTGPLHRCARTCLPMQKYKLMGPLQVWALGGQPSRLGLQPTLLPLYSQLLLRPPGAAPAQGGAHQQSSYNKTRDMLIHIFRNSRSVSKLLSLLIYKLVLYSQGKALS